MKPPWIVAVVLSALRAEARTPPHIVIIVIDDLGFNDVPWNNPDSLATNIGRHARSGVILGRHYTHAACSPSRAALLTGKYAWRLGLQRGNIGRYQPAGLGTEHKLLPEYLKSGGYVTHAIGKWHLGYCHDSYTPTRRGFDTFFGMYSDSTHYRSRLVVCDNHDFNKDMIGYDLRRNESVSKEYHRRFSPNMYAKEARKVIRQHDASKPLFLYLPLMALQSPHVGNAPRRFRHLYDSSTTKGFESSDRMREVLLLSVDYAIHKVMEELRRSELYSNSLVLVTTDNGGEAWDSNSPLRGTRDTVYEGGIRGAAFLSSPLLGRSYTYTGLMHLVDWTPTLLHAAGLPIPPDLDGKSLWHRLRANSSSPRTNIIHNIDEDPLEGTFQAVITHRNYKLIWGQEFLLDRAQPLQADKVQLYDVYQDPEERSNIASENMEIVDKLKTKLLQRKGEFVPAIVTRSTRKGWPSNFGGYLSPGWCTAR